MKVRYAPRAFADREQILEYLSRRSASGARNVAASIRSSVEQLGDHPHSGYRTDAPDVRVIFVTRYVRDVVEIVHIRHTSRRSWRGEK